jgi:hypothetical protein
MNGGASGSEGISLSCRAHLRKSKRDIQWTSVVRARFTMLAATATARAPSATSQSARPQPGGGPTDCFLISISTRISLLHGFDKLVMILDSPSDGWLPGPGHSLIQIGETELLIRSKKRFLERLDFSTRLFAASVGKEWGRADDATVNILVFLFVTTGCY